MSIGGTLAKARRDAGLSVAEVSQRTRIRETIIRGIEDDDYSACGGDFYARGHLRSIARAVGADPDPLVKEYDETLRAPQEITAADALQPLLPIRADGRRGPDDTRSGPRLNWAAVLALALIVVLGFLGYRLAFGGGPAPAPGRAHRQAGQAAPPRSASARPATPRATLSAPPTVALPAVSAAAFGPEGTAEGDNPQSAALALAGHPATPWHTSWYATARFGDLKAGTGPCPGAGR
jgi:cytoskeletal protein RodZ